MASYSLFKNVLKKSIIDSIYNEIITKNSRYYHWLGKENSWKDFLSPFIPSSSEDIPGPPQDNYRYELHVRRDILTVKAINPSDVSYVIPRINWESNTTYDIYDDAYTDPISTAINWQPGLTLVNNDIIKVGTFYYRASNSGTLSTELTPPTHTVGTVKNGTVDLLYLMRDTIAYSGATSLEKSKFYVLTSEFNVYKCIWNNNDKPSTVMPTTTPSDSLVTTADGYKWKFMYTIPISLRNRFLSSEWIPVSTALKAPFFSNGAITSLTIDNPGSGYTDGDIILVSGDGYLPDNPYAITNIEIIQGGLGYTAAPAIAFTAPALTGTTATGTTTISASVVNAATLVLPGFGYNDYPTISVLEPIAFTAIWSEGAGVFAGNIIKRTVPVTINDVIYQQDIYYQVSVNGDLGSTPPLHTTPGQAVLNGTVNLTVVAKRAVLKAVLTKTEASLTPIIVGGQITGVTINKPGIGYTNANIEIFAIGGTASTGTGAVITPNFSVGNINTLQADIELDAAQGSIEVIKVVDPGSGYGSADIQILGDGRDAEAVAVISAGQLSEVIVTNPGLGYTWTDVVITGVGSGATARAIMSPIKGHGSNAIDELNANSLMFYSSISRDKNQGIEVDNDYRKAGLLKNIKAFDTGLLFTGDTGSGCVLIEGNFDPLKIKNDLLLQKDGYKNYRVVSFNNTQILLSVFNNFTINSNDLLTIAEEDTEGNNNIGYSFTVNKVTERTIDQFSGDLLFLTVREKFSPTAEQIFTLRTVITI